MDEKKTSLFVLGILTIVFFAFAILLFKLYKGGPALEDSLKGVGTRHFVYKASDSIRKFTMDNGIGYEIYGYFESIEKSGLILEGLFVISQDSKATKIKTYVGHNDSKVFFGKYEGSFSSTSKWTTVDQSEVLERLKNKTPVKLTVHLICDSTQETRSYVSEKELVYDKILTDMKSGFVGDLPDDFYIYAFKVGIIETSNS